MKKIITVTQNYVNGYTFLPKTMKKYGPKGAKIWVYSGLNICV